MVVLRQSENGFLLVEIPNDHVAILAALARGEQRTVVGDGKAGDLVVMSSQEVLVVRVLQIAHDDRRRRNQNELLQTWVQVD